MVPHGKPAPGDDRPNDEVEGHRPRGAKIKWRCPPILDLASTLIAAGYSPQWVADASLAMLVYHEAATKRRHFERVGEMARGIAAAFDEKAGRKLANDMENT